MAFQLDPPFLSGSHAVCDLSLCHVRLQDDARFPWLVLIPRIAGAVEIEDLALEDRARLLEEALAAGRAVRAFGQAVEKLNIGQLGNITRQLHVHVVGRRPGDDAWPGPVWVCGTAEPYAPGAREAALAAARAALSGAN